MATINNVGVGLSGSTGSGSFVGSTSPTLVTPVLGAATATSINFGGSTLSTYTTNTSWTPTFTFATAGDLSVAYTTQLGTYAKIGSIVIATFNLSATPTFTTSSGEFAIGGLPIASASGLGHYGSVQSAGTFLWPNTGTTLSCTVGSLASSIQIVACANAKNSTKATTTAFTTGALVQFTGTIIYLASS